MALKKELAVFICAAAITAMLVSCGDLENRDPSQSYKGPVCQLNVSKSPANGGAVNINGEDDAPAASVRPEGATITLIAKSAEGYEFINWTAESGSLPAFINGGSVANPVVTFTINSNVYIQANFQAKVCTLNINRIPAAGGDVLVDGISNPAGALTFNAGETITLEARPASGYLFTYWMVSGGSVAKWDSETTTMTLRANVTVTAAFHTPATVNPGELPGPLSPADITGGISGSGGSGGGTVNTYPFPGGMPAYTDVTVTAEGHAIDLYSVRVNPTHRWDTNTQNFCVQAPVAMFDMSGSVSIEVTTPVQVDASNVVVRPLAYNISPSVSGNRISFNIPKTGQYSVEWNNSQSAPNNALLIFANPIESFSGTRTLEAGMHGSQELGSGETLYLKPGAVVRGRIKMNSNSKLVGRGVIDGSHLDDWVNPGINAVIPIQTSGANNVEIRGVSIFDPNGWTVEFRDTSNVTIDNLKIISSRCNGDGISIQSSNGISITNSFLRTWDDGIVVKNYTGKDSYDISVSNCIFWTDLAQSMELGVETNKAARANPKIYDVAFEGITIFHALHKAPISIHNGDNAAISNITFRNIVVENYWSGLGDGWNYLIDITNLTGSGMGGASGWTKVSARGSISGVIVEGVKVLDGRPLMGARFDSREGGYINNVAIKDIYRGEIRQDFFGNIGNNTAISWQ